jgi:hypothetical protein
VLQLVGVVTSPPISIQILNVCDNINSILSTLSFNYSIFLSCLMKVSFDRIADLTSPSRDTECVKKMMTFGVPLMLQGGGVYIVHNVGLRDWTSIGKESDHEG